MTIARGRGGVKEASRNFASNLIGCMARTGVRGPYPGLERNRRVRVGVVFLLASSLLLSGDLLGVAGAEEGLQIPDYSRWHLEEEATTYRPGTDLQFYTLELKSYSNPEHFTEKVVELRRNDILYILYYYAFTKAGARWDIYMDAGFADAPCGFLDPNGKPTGRYVRIDLACLRETERVDLRFAQ